MPSYLAGEHLDQGPLPYRLYGSPYPPPFRSVGVPILTAVSTGLVHSPIASHAAVPIEQRTSSVNPPFEYFEEMINASADEQLEYHGGFLDKDTYSECLTDNDNEADSKDDAQPWLQTNQLPPDYYSRGIENYDHQESTAPNYSDLTKASIKLAEDRWRR
jgi:hypothetical protein